MASLFPNAWVFVVALVTLWSALDPVDYEEAP